MAGKKPKPFGGKMKRRMVGSSESNPDNLYKKKPGMTMPSMPKNSMVKHMKEMQKKGK